MSLSTDGNEPQGTEPQGTEPQGTEPQGTEPQGTEPQGDQQSNQQNSQSQPQGQQSSDGDQGQPERTAPKAADYKLPEGAPDVREWAAANDMTQEQLDASLSQFGKVMQETTEAQAQNLRQMGEQHLQKWGDEAKYNLNLAKQALSANDPDGSLKQALNESGYGNHPAVLEFMFKVGKSMEEGGFIKSNIKAPQGNKSAAQVLFGNTHPST